IGTLKFQQTMVDMLPLRTADAAYSKIKGMLSTLGDQRNTKVSELEVMEMCKELLQIDQDTMTVDGDHSERSGKKMANSDEESLVGLSLFVLGIASNGIALENGNGKKGNMRKERGLIPVYHMEFNEDPALVDLDGVVELTGQADPKTRLSALLIDHGSIKLILI
ncbi:hypothetical protein Tco_1064665, partial [Tanacetum coccineum]